MLQSKCLPCEGYLRSETCARSHGSNSPSGPRRPCAVRQHARFQIFCCMFRSGSLERGGRGHPCVVLLLAHYERFWSMYHIQILSSGRDHSCAERMICAT